MNREILFRGKRIDNGEWAYGDLANEPDGIFIRWIYKPSSNQFSWRNFKDMVIPESVGQFTGLTDKNGNKIFEWDYDKNYDVVMWCNKKNGWSMNCYDFPTKTHIDCHCYNCSGNFELSEITNQIEIIGNIHDNPEILE